jgi:hypothetical protein
VFTQEQPQATVSHFHAFICHNYDCLEKLESVQTVVSLHVFEQIAISFATFSHRFSLLSRVPCIAD